MATALQGLQRAKVVHNKHYKKSGTKSYVWLLNKWGFEPTMPGPYFQMVKKVPAETHHHGILQKLAQMAGKKVDAKVLVKKKPGTSGSIGEVGAEDQQLDSMYLTEVDIGTPAQKLMLDFDTGSSDLWVWSTHLPSSTKSQGKGHNIFDPAKSTTFKNTTGSAWKIQYGDQSSASGTVGTDDVTIGGLTIQNQAIEMATRMSSQFVQGTGDGLLGLAWGNINTVKPKQVATPVQNMITESDIPTDAQLFTAYLGSWRDAEDSDHGASFYTFGYIDQEIVKASGEEIHWADVDNSQGFWTIHSTSATVNGTNVDRNGNTAIMDTGTTLALIDDATCKAIYAAIPGSTYDEENQGYIFPTTVTEDQLPVVTFDLGGKQFAVQKEDLGFSPAKDGWWYGSIQSRGSMDFDILGDAILKSIYAIFDQGNKRFGAVKRIDTTTNLGLPPDTTTDQSADVAGSGKVAAAVGSHAVTGGV